MSIDRIGVVGGGAWGTALAQVAATGGRETLLWALEPDVVAAINTAHENSIYLKGLALDPAIRATSDLAELAECDAWLMVTPAQHMRTVLERASAAGARSRTLRICWAGVTVSHASQSASSARSAVARIAGSSGSPFR